MINKILVAYDGSQQAEKAYVLALDLAAKYSAQVIVLAVAGLPEPPASIEKEAVLRHAREYYQPLFDSLTDQARSFGIAPQFDVCLGHPAEQIIHFADHESIDMILIGHRGRSVLQRWLLGSVAKRVLNHAKCTVVVVR